MGRLQDMSLIHQFLTTPPTSQRLYTLPNKSRSYKINQKTLSRQSLHLAIKVRVTSLKMNLKTVGATIMVAIGVSNAMTIDPCAELWSLGYRQFYPKPVCEKILARYNAKF